MSAKSTIEWTDATWNPVTGCTKVSQGCKNCYAETWANRKMGEFSKDKNRGFTDIICHGDKLNIPSKWQKPKRIFVNSMSDLFHEEVPFGFIDKVFQVIEKCERHTFQILTKRPERMQEFFRKAPWRLKNVWLGVSVEDQKTADKRIPILLQVPAVVRWISAEPLLGEIDLNAFLGVPQNEKDFFRDLIKLDWVVVGGESGSKARPINYFWVKRILHSCIATNVPFFFKQWGQWVDPTQIPDYDYHIKYAEKIEMNNRNYYKLGKSVSKNFIDGKQYLEMPITLN